MPEDKKPKKDEEVKDAMASTTSSEHSMSLPKKDKSKKVWIVLFVITLLALIGLGVYGYTKVQSDNKKIKDQQAQIEDLQNNKKTLEDAAAAAKAALNTATNKSDNDLINTATINYLEAVVGAKNNQTFKIEDININSSKNFATVSIGVLQNGQRTTGYAVVLKKVNGSWVPILQGQQTLPEDVTKYGIPNDFN